MDVLPYLVALYDPSFGAELSPSEGVHAPESNVGVEVGTASVGVEVSAGAEPYAGVAAGVFAPALLAGP